MVRLKSILWQVARAAVPAAFLVILILTGLIDNLLFHAIARILCIGIGGAIFMSAWNYPPLQLDSFLALIGFSFVFTGLLDMLGLLADPGVNVLPRSGPNVASQLWIAARLLQSLSFLVAAAFIGRKTRSAWLLGAFFVVTSLLLLSILAWDIFPASDVAGSGPTAFAIASKLAINLILAAAGLAIFSRRSLIDVAVLRLLLLSIMANVLAEFAFMLPATANAWADLAGHLLIVISYFLTFQAMITIPIRQYSDRMERLQKTEQADAYLRAAIESAIDGFWMVDLQGTILEVNDAYVRTSGYTREELLGKRVGDLDARDTPEMIHARIERVLRGDPQVFTSIHRTKSGGVWPVEVNAVYWSIGEGRIFCFLRDIRHRNRSDLLIALRGQLTQMASASGLHAMLQLGLDSAEMLTSSSVAFFHFLEDDQDALSLQSWSTQTSQQTCKAVGISKHNPISKAGTWAECVSQRKAVIHNDFASLPNLKGMPEGHVALARTLTLPVMREGRVVAILGVGNKNSDYTQEDIDLLQNLAELVVDMVERQHTLDALRQSEELYRGLVESTIAIIVTLDAQGTIHYANDRIARYAGTSIEDLVGHNVNDLLPADFAHNLVEGVRAVLASGKGSADEIKVDFLDSPAWFHSTIQPIHNAAGQPVLALLHAVEITDRKEAEEALRLSEERYKRLSKDLELRVLERTAEIDNTRQRLMLAAQAADLGIWEWNVQTNRLIWDETMFKLYGLHHDQFDGTFNSFFAVLYPEDVMLVQKAMQDGLAGKDLTTIEYRILRPDDGSLRYIRAHGLFLHDSDGQTRDVIGTIMDVTNARQVEVVLRQANQEMETALRMKDEFLANMSHELRTPLNAILGISESLQEEIMGPLNEKQKRYVQVVNESGHHLLELINDILDLSKIEAGRMEMEYQYCDVQQLCHASLRMVTQIAQKKALSITFENDERVRSIYIDPRRIKQVLANLLSNAVKFTPTGGRVGLELHAEPSEGQVTFVVWDTGIGIRPEDMGRLFQPFVQLDAGLNREHSGTGLGLALAAQIVRRHGGRLELQSTEGEGSRFSVILPWRAETPIQTRPNAGDAFKPDHTRPYSETILLIEDTDSTILPVSDYLSAQGFQVIVARDGLSGIEEARRHKPALILTDIQMPGMDGFEMAHQIRSDPSLTHIPIVALTALAMTGDRERCLAAGMTDYLSKPVRLRELLSVITRHIQHAQEDE